MKAVLPEVPQLLLDQRKRTGADRWDEMWIVDRDTKAPELYLLDQGEYTAQTPNNEGWVESPATGICLRPEPSRKLAIQLASDHSTRHTIPPS